MFAQFKANALLNTNATEDFKDVFDNINLSDSSLGNSVSARAKALSQLVERIDSIDFHDDSGHDILGDVYEYLIAEFAGASGKKAGEFYTPHEVSRVLAKLVTYVSHDSSEEAKEVIEHASRPFMVYDPTMGSGSLLLTVQHELKSETDNPDTARVHFFGQEINRTTYNLARMNLMMHDVKYQYMDLRCADTLESDWPNGMDENGIDHPEFFDAVVANPPYSLKWDNAESKLKDPRFKDYGKLAPKSKADYAFVEHGIYHLKPSGRMAIVLPTVFSSEVQPKERSAKQSSTRTTLMPSSDSLKSLLLHRHPHRHSRVPQRPQDQRCALHRRLAALREGQETKPPARGRHRSDSRDLQESSGRRQARARRHP